MANDKQVTGLSVFNKKKINPRKIKNDLFHMVLLSSILFSVIVLFLLLYQIFSEGMKWLDWDFITSMPSRSPEKAGIFSALTGSIWTIGITALIALPLGVGTAVYLEEYANKKRVFYKLLVTQYFQSCRSTVYRIWNAGLGSIRKVYEFRQKYFVWCIDFKHSDSANHYCFFQGSIKKRTTESEGRFLRIGNDKMENNSRSNLAFCVTWNINRFHSGDFQSNG